MITKGLPRYDQNAREKKERRKREREMYYQWRAQARNETIEDDLEALVDYPNILITEPVDTVVIVVPATHDHAVEHAKVSLPCSRLVVISLDGSPLQIDLTGVHALVLMPWIRAALRHQLYDALVGKNIIDNWSYNDFSMLYAGATSEGLHAWVFVMPANQTVCIGKMKIRSS